MNIKSIRSQMLIYLLFGLLVLFGLLIYVVHKELNKLPEHIMSHYQEITDARGAEVNKELEKYVQKIKMISQSPVVRSMDLERIQEYLPFLVIDGQHHNMTIAGLDGKGWTTFGTTIDISKQEQYQKIILEGHPYWISQPFISPFGDLHKPIVIISHEVRTNEGIVGLVNIVMDLQFLKNVARSLNLGYTGYAWIVDREGAIIAHPNNSVGFKRNISEFIPEIDAFKRNDSIGYFEHIGDQGENIVTFYKEIGENTGWTLLLSINTEEVLGGVSGARLKIIFAFAFGILFMSIFAFYYSRSISKPILELKKVFEKAETGNLNVTADETVKNEIGAAAKSFNQMLRQIKKLTYHDPLTQLYNLNGFLANLPPSATQLKGKYPISAIVIISVDDFKRINSISGYKDGNLVLQKLAKQLKGFIRIEEGIGRYFGDEFILLLKGDSLKELEERVNQLWEQCKIEINFKDTEYRLKVSIGIAVTANTEIQVEEIVNQANIAKIQAKKDGGNRYQFYDMKINESFKLEQKIENALYRAIEKGELYLVYQPIVDLKLNKIIGTEALIRWKHEKFKTVPPLEIIKVAEKAGFIIDIGRWVLTEALKQNKRWQEQGFTSMFVSVNISALQFDQYNFVEMVKGIIEKTSTDPKFLELEITETNAMTMVEEKMIKLRKLKEMGIRIAIDDFGTGYSSLAYFTRFPINTLKIDRSFVSDIFQDENAKMIITTIINMAKSINIATTAEGVETLEQLKFLEKQGCDKIQGYLISEPVRSEQVEQLLQKKTDSKSLLSKII